MHRTTFYCLGLVTGSVSQFFSTWYGTGITRIEWSGMTTIFTGEIRNLAARAMISNVESPTLHRQPQTLSEMGLVSSSGPPPDPRTTMTCSSASRAITRKRPTIGFQAITHIVAKRIIPLEYNWLSMITQNSLLCGIYGSGSWVEDLAEISGKAMNVHKLLDMENIKEKRPSRGIVPL